MKLCYQVATPDVAGNSYVTAYQGPPEESFGTLASLGYDGVELMTLYPEKLRREAIKKLAEDLGLSVALVSTGEVFGQLRLSFTDPDGAIREEAIERVKRIVDFAGYLGAKVNLGRVRGQYEDGIPRERTEEWAVDAFRRVSEHAAPLGVVLAIENVTMLQTNFLNTMDEVNRLAEATDRPNCKAMMDVFHMHIEERDVLAAIRRYAYNTVHVHLADSNRRYPGNGRTDFTKLITAFHDCGYDEAFTVEVYQTPNMHASAQRAIAHLAPIFEKVYARPAKRDLAR